VNDDDSWKEAVRLLLEKGVVNAIVTAGSKGVMAGNADGIRHYPAISGVHVEDVTGAGDAFVSGVLHGHLTGMAFEDRIRCGLLNAAKRWLQAQPCARSSRHNNLNLKWRNSDETISRIFQGSPRSD